MVNLIFAKLLPVTCYFKNLLQKKKVSNQNYHLDQLNWMAIESVFNFFFFCLLKPEHMNYYLWYILRYTYTVNYCLQCTGNCCSFISFFFIFLYCVACLFKTFLINFNSAWLDFKQFISFHSCFFFLFVFRNQYQFINNDSKPKHKILACKHNNFFFFFGYLYKNYYFFML